jgi:hypothetical protein
MMFRTKLVPTLLWMAVTGLFFLTTAAFQYQKDTDDNCTERQVEDCTKSETVWFQCPITCSNHLFREGTMKEVPVDEDPEDFFQMQVTKQNGNTLELQDFEGYVTLYAVIPLMPGMAQFYYEMLEHVQTIFPYTVETLVAPYITTSTVGNNNNNNNVVTITPHKEPKTILLKEEKEPTPVLEYLMNAEIVAGNDDTDLLMDRVTIFIVTVDGMFIERLTSPTMRLLERRVSVFLMQFKTEL